MFLFRAYGGIRVPLIKEVNLSKSSTSTECKWFATSKTELLQKYSTNLENDLFDTKLAYLKSKKGKIYFLVLTSFKTICQWPLKRG